MGTENEDSSSKEEIRNSRHCSQLRSKSTKIVSEITQVSHTYQSKTFDTSLIHEESRDGRKSKGNLSFGRGLPGLGEKSKNIPTD